MSRFVAGLVYKKRAGSMARKAILAYCAERANDDGSGVWASKARIAKEVECSKQTVIDVIRSLQSDGLLQEVGHKKTPNGYVVEYSMVLAAISLLPDAVDDVYAIAEGEGSKSGPVKPVDPTSQVAGPHQSSQLTPPVKPVDPNRPLTVLEPSLNPTPVGADLFSAMEDAGDQKPDKAHEFWEAYPRCKRKTDRPEALELFRKIVAGKHKKIPKADPDVIIAAVRRFAASGDDPDYMPLPTTWLNGARWEQFGAPVPDAAARRARLMGPQFGEVVR